MTVKGLFLPICRCFVRQQDQAVKVCDPLVLAEYFEALIGTSGYAASVAHARQGVSDRIKKNEVLRAAVDRQAVCSKVHVEVYTPQDA